MSWRQQKEEIKRILKRIYRKSQVFYCCTFYYKLRGERLSYIQLNSSEDYSRMLDIIFDPRLDYALYVDFTWEITPSQNCIKQRSYENIAMQFIALFSVSEYRMLAPFIEHIAGVEHTARGRDPLSQVFAYRRLLLRRWPQHVYICPYLYSVVPYDPDPSSIFHGREGVVAYCLSLRDFAEDEIYVGIINVYRALRNILDRAVDKLRNNKVLEEWWRSGFQRACDVDYISREIIRDDIEEAEKLMKQYGIIRVTLPLR